MGLATKAPVPPSKPVEKVTNIKTQTLKNTDLDISKAHSIH